MAMTEDQLREFFKGNPAALERALTRLNGKRRAANAKAPSGRQKAVEATGRYWRTECPRHLWPRLHDALVRSKAGFATGMCNGSVEVLVAERGVAVAERFGLAIGGRASDPWPAKLKANEARDKFRNAAGPDPLDPFEVAFRRYAEEVRAGEREGAA